MNLNEVLIELGFNEYGDGAWETLFKNYGDRFKHRFRFYEDENELYIDVFKSSGPCVINSTVLINNHNGLSTGALNKFNGIKEALKDFDIKIY